MVHRIYLPIIFVLAILMISAGVAQARAVPLGTTASRSQAQLHYSPRRAPIAASSWRVSGYMVSGVPRSAFGRMKCKSPRNIDGAPSGGEDCFPLNPNEP